MTQFSYRLEPFSHQRAHLERYRDTKRRGLFWDMGTGKTKVILDNFQWLYLAGEVDTLVVIAPNGVHRNWITDEVPTHLPEWMAERTRSIYWETGKSGTLWYREKLKELLKHSGPVIVTIPYTAMITELAKQYLYKILEDRRCFYVSDESHHFKAPGIKRTKTVHASCKYSQYRRIMSGTPITNGAFDVYSQMKFLDLEFWKKHGLDNFTIFKNYFGVFEENQFIKDGRGEPIKICVGYQHMEELQGIIAEHTDRVLKDDVLDLPPKLYNKHYFKMTTSQRRIYEELKEEFITWLDDKTCVTAPLAITRLLRLQQVVSGYLPTEDGENPVHELMPDSDNPRLLLLGQLLEDIPHQGIIFAKFRRDIDKITALLGPKRCVRYDGKVTDDERAEAKAQFQKGAAQWFVANQGMAAEGLTLVQAKTVIYYNNNYKLTDRLQSEDRAHRPGQTHPVGYNDLICEDSIDLAVVQNLREKRDLSLLILQDQFKKWL